MAANTTGTTPKNGLFDVTKIMGDFRVPGIDLEAAVASQRKNIEQPVARPVALSLVGAGQSGGIDAAMKGIEDRRLGAIDRIELQYGHLRLGGDGGEADGAPAVASGERQGGIDDARRGVGSLSHPTDMGISEAAGKR